MSRIPEMEWHYELLMKKSPPLAYAYVNDVHSSHLCVSKYASKEWLQESLPNLEIGELDKEWSDKQPRNKFGVKPKAELETAKSAIKYSSLLSDVNMIIKMDKPIHSYLLWHFMYSYGWSIISRYTPDLLQEIDSGSLSEWKPFLDEYSWLVRIIMPTACLNHITKSDWRFSPPSLFGG